MRKRLTEERIIGFLSEAKRTCQLRNCAVGTGSRNLVRYLIDQGLNERRSHRSHHLLAAKRQHTGPTESEGGWEQELIVR